MTRLIIVCISGVLPEHLSANQSTIFKVGLDKGQVPFLYLGLMALAIPRFTDFQLESVFSEEQ